MDSEVRNEFSVRLRKLRERTGRKQYAVAHCFGVSRRTLSRYEKGELEPTKQILIHMADYFGVSIDYLVGRTDNPKMNR